MLFDERKIQPADLVEMMSCPIDTIEPYSFLLAPAYLYMRLNNRVVSVKAPLDFFTPEELDRIRRYQMIYFPKFVNAPVKFQTAGRLVKKILSREEDKLPRATFEIMREVSHQVSELWYRDMRVEPFFAAVFTQELCSPLDPELLLWARENAVVRHDEGLLISGLFVFVAVQLGWLNLEELNRSRKEIYKRTVKGEEWLEPKSEQDSIVVELKQFMDLKGELTLSELVALKTEWSQHLSARLKGWEQKLSRKNEKSPSIYGPEGFIAEDGRVA